MADLPDPADFESKKTIFILFPDAVTVVLYNMMKAFNNMETIPMSQVNSSDNKTTHATKTTLNWQHVTELTFDASGT